jgi:PLP dependent protein
MITSSNLVELKKTLGKAHLVAVSKNRPVEDIVSLAGMGQRHFGESRVAELIEKSQKVSAEVYEGLSWHFMGKLQTNKIKKLLKVPHLHYLHSLENQKQWQHLCLSEESLSRDLGIFIQVNVSEEPQKGGVIDFKELLSLSEQVVGHRGPHLRFKGLMGMASNDELHREKNAKLAFTKLCDYGKRLSESLPGLENSIQYSMGMSQDYLTAIKFGSDFVRIGRALF